MRNLRLIAAGIVLLASLARADGRNSATVSRLEGGDATDGGRALSVDSQVYEGETVETGEGAKLELKMQDGSVVRVGPQSKLLLKSAYFSGGKKGFSAKLLFGRVWSKVSGLMGGDSKFEVETDNAVAGVRGTTFRVDASKDKSVLVRVYAGAVAMNGPGVPRPEHDTSQPQGRHRKAPPQEITKAQWEKLVGQMMQIRIAADGTPGDPEPFKADADTGDEWAAWNAALDENAK